MTIAPEGEPRAGSHKIDRLTSLLAHDLSYLSPFSKAPVTAQIPNGQTAFAFTEPSGDEGCTREPRLVGFDEAGRGALAGPVTVACVSFDLRQIILPSGAVKDVILETYKDLNDSKKVAPRVRTRLFELIQQNAHWGIGCASAVEIDQMGIVPACHTAARRAYRGLGICVERALFDRGLSLGKEETTRAFELSQHITKGDAKSFHIAAASILAKVQRDAILCTLDVRENAYGFARHKGYGSADHIAAIQQHGPSRFHRKTFLTRIL